MPRIPKRDRPHYADLLSAAYLNLDDRGLDEIDADTALAGPAQSLELGDEE